MKSTLSFALFILAAGICSAQMTTVTGSMTDPAGDAISGTCSLQAVSAFSTSGGLRVIGAPTIVKFTAGVFSAQLVPTDSATLAGQYYTVTCFVPQQMVKGHTIGPYTSAPKYWLVPTSTLPVDIGNVEITSGPPSPSFNVLPQQIAQGGATIGQGLVWTLTGWQPGAVASGTWGSIIGTLSNQTDLQNALNSINWSTLSGKPTAFAPSAHASTHGLYGSDPLYLDAAQITTGVLSPSLIPGLSYQAPITGAPGTWPSFSLVATSGSYADLSGKPSIPAAQVNADWNAVSGLPQILNKPVLSAVATSGSYNDLSSKPTIPSTTTQITEGTNLYFTTLRAQAALAGLYQTPIASAPATWPSFAVVATSGSYNDLSSTPTIPSTTSQITEGTNLYFTAARVLTAMSGLYQSPIASAPASWPTSFTPSAHAATHSYNGSDPISSLGSLAVNGNLCAGGVFTCTSPIDLRSSGDIALGEAGNYGDVLKSTGTTTYLKGTSNVYLQGNGASIVHASGTNFYVHVTTLFQTDNSADIGASGANRPRNLYVAGLGNFGGTITAGGFSGPLTGAVTGNSSTASALAGTPTLCTAGQAPTGILASGNATGCASITGGSGMGDPGSNGIIKRTALNTTAPAVLADVTGLLGTGSTAVTNLSLTGLFAATNASTSVNGVACALSSTCTVADSTKVPTTTTVNGHALSGNVTVTASDVSLGSVTNAAQTLASVVPNTVPSAAQLMVGNAGGTAYAPVSLTQDCTISSAGAINCTKSANVAFSGLATLTETDGSFAFGYGGAWTKQAMPASANMLATDSSSRPAAGTGHNVSVIRSCVAASGSGTAYTCTTAPTFVPATGDQIDFKSDVANTASATLAVNGATAAPIKKWGGSGNLIANDLLAGHWVSAVFDGTSWQLEGQLGNSNAPTASALASTPTLCSTGQAPTGISANGNATGCASVGGGSPVRSFTFTISGSPITTGNVYYFPVSEFSCSINNATITANAVGSITVDIWKANAAVPTSANKISASAPVTLSSAQFNLVNSVSTWSQAVVANDMFGASVASVDGVLNSATVQVWCQ